MKERNKLFRYNKLYDHIHTDNLFIKAMKENIRFHSNHNSKYKVLLLQENFSLDKIQSIDDLQYIPPLPTLFLKENKLFSISSKKFLFSAKSSGTSGKQSHVGLDLFSAVSALRMCIKVFRDCKLFSLKPACYIMLSYEPSDFLQTGASQTAYGITLLAPALHREYAFKADKAKKEYYLNADGIISTIRKYATKNKPIRFMGFPSFLYLLLEKMKKENIKVKLHKDSKVFTAGGWKEMHEKKIGTKELQQLAEEVLGVPSENIRDFFGAVEHPILYTNCRNGYFHLPTYSRAIIRDVNTLKPLNFEGKGLLNLLTPLMGTMPLGSIITDDIASLHEGKTCGCGIETPYIKLYGRASHKHVKICATDVINLVKDEVMG